MQENATAVAAAPHVGVENLQKATKAVMDLIKQGVESGSDGWQVMDFISFIDELSAIPGVVKSAKQIYAELLDMDKADRAAIEAYIEKEFDIPNDRVEIVVEHAIAMALSTVSLTQEIKAIKEKKEMIAKQKV